MTRSPVCSYNEWDPLEEVVVGRLEGAMIPSKHLTVSFNIPRRLTGIYKLVAGRPYPKFVVRPAQRELDEFMHILEAEGITVRRPAVTDFSATYKTPHWQSKGFCAALAWARLSSRRLRCCHSFIQACRPRFSPARVGCWASLAS